MASELKVDKITGVATAGSISVTGEGNSTTTNLQQGLAKVWVFYDQSSGTGSVEDSLNVSSADDDGTGEQGINFSNSMGNAVYSVTGFNEDGTGENDAIGIHKDDGQTRSASEFNYLCMSGTSKNEGKSSLQVFGDLA